MTMPPPFNVVLPDTKGPDFLVVKGPIEPSSPLCLFKAVWFVCKAVSFVTTQKLLHWVFFLHRSEDQRITSARKLDIVSFSKGAAFDDRELSLKFSSQKANP